MCAGRKCTQDLKACVCFIRVILYITHVGAPGVCNFLPHFNLLADMCRFTSGVISVDTCLSSCIRLKHHILDVCTGPVNVLKYITRYSKVFILWLHTFI